MSEWRSYAVRLADQLRASSDLRTPAWYTAIAETPRHLLVPTVYESPQQSYGSCTDVLLNTAEHLELVLAVRDGSDGWPQHAPYDRIICTCAVRRIPWAWYDQLTDGGQLLVDFKPHGGNLVLLERKSDRLEGRFTARYAAFMVMRQHDNPSPQWQPEIPLDRERTTITPAEPPGVIRFLRSVMSTTQLRHRYTFDERTRQPIAIRLAAADGSCCEVELTPAKNGTRIVREGGPTPLRQEVEHAYRRWCDWGEPGWNRVGITVKPETWTVWLDEPKIQSTERDPDAPQVCLPGFATRPATTAACLHHILD